MAASSNNINMKVHGQKEVAAKMTQIIKDLEGNPILEAMRDVVLLVLADAKRNSPVNYGMLRASIMPEIVKTSRQVDGFVGSNLVYAPAQELGTRPFWPPITPLLVWVRRKKMASGKSAIYAVAKSIQRGIATRGIKGKFYLKRALESNLQKIEDRFIKGVIKIIKE